MFETERLILRAWQESDIEPFVAMNQDHNVMKYFPSIYSREQTLQYVAKYNLQLEQQGYTIFACELKANKKFIGFVGLAQQNQIYDFAPCTEIGWRIAYEYWNQGFATEAALKCLELGFNKFNLDEIVSFTAKENLKSQHIMQKIGMKYDKEFLHPKLPTTNKLALHVLYRINKQESNLS